MTPTFETEWAAPLAVAGFCVAILTSLPRQQTWGRTLAVVTTILVTVRYMWWRLIETVLPVEPSPGAGAWVWIVFFVELAALVNASVSYLMLTRTSDHSDEANEHERRLRRLPVESLPRVDVFLCTYNEDLEILEGPILAACNMDYPNFTVWVLDDGRRAWLSEFCAAHGVRYLTRPNNEHAKAGNINNALSKTDAELFAILDADFTPRRDFLMRTVGFFADPKIAIVQAPHHFLNPDIYSMNLGMGEQWPDEQRLFFDIVQPSRDAWDCAFCCGSVSVQRRSALLGIGGVPTDSVTEDILSSLALLRQGYTTRYLNEPLAFGLAPEGIAAMFVQRQRWCRGGLQLLFLRDGVLGPGLTALERLLFFPTDWLVQTPVRLFAVVVPIVFLWTGLAPLQHADLPDLINYQIPVLMANMGLMTWLSGGRYLPFLSTGFSLLLSFRLVPTIVATLIKPFGAPFRVTPKGSGAARGVDHWSRGCAMFLLILTILGLLLNARPETQVIADPDHRAAALFFSVLNAAALVLAILAGRDRNRLRVTERFTTSASVVCELENGTLVPAMLCDVSATGALVEWPGGQPVPRWLEMHVTENHTISATVMRHDGDKLGVRFAFTDANERIRMLLWLYSISRNTVGAPLSLGRLAGRLVARCLK